MRSKHLHALIALAMTVCLVTSCHSDLNLNQVDASVEARLNVALPIGTIRLGVMKLFGITDTTANVFVNTETNVIEWRGEDKPAPKKFSLFNLAEKLDPNPFSINLYERLAEATVQTPLGPVSILSLTGNQIIIPSEATHDFADTLFFDMNMALGGVNSPNASERVDSALLSLAHFSTVVTKRNFDDLTWDWINAIYLDLGKSFEVHNGSKRILLYKKGDPGIDFGKSMKAYLDTVSMNLMIDPSKRPAMTNVYDTIVMQTIVDYCIPRGTVASINEASGIRCDFNVEKIQMEALWGWFVPGPDMQDEGTYSFDNKWDNMPIFKNAVLPFSRPKIEVSAETEVAGAIKMHGSYMRSWDKDNVMHEATFDGKTSFDTIFPIPPCADPAGPMDKKSHIDLLFDHTEHNGHIDKLFDGGIPKKISYQFLFSFDDQTSPQIRIPRDTYVQLYSKITMPFSFKQGTRLQHSALIEDIDISQFNVDSLAAQAHMKVDSTSSVGVIMKTTSAIPLHVKLQLRCLDDSNKPLIDPETGKEFGIFESDTLDIYPPTYSKDSQGQWTASINEVINTANLTKRQLDLFPKTKSVRYTMWVDDNAMKEAYEQGLYDIQIKADQVLKLQIGLTADVEAAFNLNDIIKSSNK